MRNVPVCAPSFEMDKLDVRAIADALACALERFDLFDTQVRRTWLSTSPGMTRGLV